MTIRRAEPRLPTAGLINVLRHRTLSASMLMVVLTTLAGAVNYASNLVFSRVLSPASFGDFTALLALTVVASVPASAAQTVIADRIARDRHEGRNDRIAWRIRHVGAHVVLWASVIGLVYLVSIPLVETTLSLQSIGPALALAPLLVLAVLTPVALGTLQGLERYVFFGAVMLGVAVARIGVGWPWALAGGGAGGALLGQALGNAVALGIVVWALRGRLSKRGTGAATAGFKRRPDRASVLAVGAFVAFAFLSNFDVVLAKIFLSPEDGGDYAALATVEKLLVFLPAAIGVIMVPRAARARVESGSAARVLRFSALGVLGVTSLVIIPAAVAPEMLIVKMFGADYGGASGGVMPIVIAGVGLAVLNLLVIYTVAIQDGRWISLIGVGCILQIAAICLFHGSADEVAVAQAGAIWLTLALNEILFHPVVRAERLALGRLVPGRR